MLNWFKQLNKEWAIRQLDKDQRVSLPKYMNELKDIGFYTLSNDRVKQSSINSPLWRCELLLTDACNFKCPYCRGSNQFTKGTLSFEESKKIVQLWINNNLKNIRFSGEEPTLMPYLPDLVAFSKAGNIERIAISTNGSASEELYATLLDAGVNDFSVSLDACCSSTGDTMAGHIKGSWAKVVNNIQFISKHSYVTVGVVLTDTNFNELIGIIEFADSLGVSDIRIISAAQWNNYLKFAELFAEHPLATKYSILNYRIQHFKNHINVRGISDTDYHKCGLVLDDMAVAGNYHFPCVIAMREGCNPIGTIDNKSIEEIREERQTWMQTTNTHNCSICRNNCLDVCRQYNNTFRDINFSNLSR